MITARSGKEALRLVLQHEFAVILLDVSMPIMDGFEAAALIRQRKASERTPIIFITAMSATDTHATRGYSLGAVDYIYAPVLPDVLRAKVGVFIDLFERAREIRRQADWLRVEAERRASNLETRLDGLLNRLNVGVFRSTIEGQLISANPAFRRIFGIAAGADLTAINIASLYQQTEERSRDRRAPRARGPHPGPPRAPAPRRRHGDLGVAVQDPGGGDRQPGAGSTAWSRTSPRARRPRPR